MTENPKPDYERESGKNNGAIRARIKLPIDQELTEFVSQQSPAYRSAFWKEFYEEGVRVANKTQPSH